MWQLTIKFEHTLIFHRHQSGPFMHHVRSVFVILENSLDDLFANAIVKALIFIDRVQLFLIILLCFNCTVCREASSLLLTK